MTLLDVSRKTIYEFCNKTRYKWQQEKHSMWNLDVSNYTQLEAFLLDEYRDVYTRELVLQEISFADASRYYIHTVRKHIHHYCTSLKVNEILFDERPERLEYKGEPDADIHTS